MRSLIDLLRRSVHALFALDIHADDDHGGMSGW